MQDVNECRMTGAIDRIRPIQTKTGSQMVEILLVVKKERFRVVSFGNVAEHLLSAAGPGDRLTISGDLNQKSWQDADGRWNHSYQVRAWVADIHGDRIEYERKKKKEKRFPKGPRKRDPNEFMYSGGPF